MVSKNFKEIKWIKDKFGIFISTLFIRTPNKFQNSKHSLVILMSFKDIKWIKDEFWAFHNSKHFWVAFLHFKDLENEGQILNFYKHFIYENFVMNFKISGFEGFAGWTCNLDFITVTWT